MRKKLTVSDIYNLSYVDFMANLDENNRPPGGKDSIRQLVQNTFLNPDSKVLDVGCNTGFCTFEIAHLVKCFVTGLDINISMVASANNFLKNYHADLLNKVKFLLGDGQRLPFDDNVFDLVMSGGSTAFIDNIPQAIKEYARITKPWGFVAEINFFYHTKPPKKLIKNLNDMMGINIQPWDEKYWLKEYEKADLEMYYYTLEKITAKSQKQVLEYCNGLINRKNWSADVKKVALVKLVKIMHLFNENHKYLSYGVFIMRKPTIKHDILF